MSQTILVVDDDEDLRTVAEDALQSLGYTVLETGDPLKAIQLVQAHPVDLLLTDVIMPLMKGTVLADRIEGVSPRTKVVLMSGYSTSDIAPSGRPFLAKPFAIEMLGQRIRETLDRPSAFARRPPAHLSRPSGA
jgi:two-component system cell cycle sensor histidine kinase/response regulator CckA